MAVTTAIAAVASAGAGIAGTMKAGQLGNDSNDRASAVFSEQQGYAQQLAALMANPSSVTNLPGYKFNFDQGADAVARKMGSSGFGGSGNEAAALTTFGQGFATSAYQTQANLLASLSGLQTATSPNSYAQTGLAGQGQSFNQLSQVLAGLGGQFANSQGSEFTPQDFITLAGGSGTQPTMNAGGGYIWNNPAAPN